LLIAVIAAATLAIAQTARAVASPTYTGSSHEARATLAVVARRPGVTAWAFTLRFTPAGAPLFRKIERIAKTEPSLELSVFCIAGPGITGLLWNAGVGTSDFGKDSVTVPRFVNAPTPKQWLCGLHVDRPVKSRRDFVSTALLVVTLTRR
jgi:hypothetical protein